MNLVPATSMTTHLNRGTGTIVGTFLGPSSVRRTVNRAVSRPLACSLDAQNDRQTSRSRSQRAHHASDGSSQAPRHGRGQHCGAVHRAHAVARLGRLEIIVTVYLVVDDLARLARTHGPGKSLSRAACPATRRATRRPPCHVAKTSQDDAGVGSCASATWSRSAPRWRSTPAVRTRQARPGHVRLRLAPAR